MKFERHIVCENLDSMLHTNNQWPSYLPFIVHITTIYSLEIEILSDIGVDQNTNQGSISHHELSKEINHHNYQDNNHTRTMPGAIPQIISHLWSIFFWVSRYMGIVMIYTLYPWYIVFTGRWKFILKQIQYNQEIANKNLYFNSCHLLLYTPDITKLLNMESFSFLFN